MGDPIAQVKAPFGSTAGLRARGADMIVVPIHVRSPSVPAFFSTVQKLDNVDGMIVTVPHKLDALRLCASASRRAKLIGAANVVRRRQDAEWYGDHCDGDGYVASVRKAGCAPEGRRALVVGAGGAGRAIAHALAEAGVGSLAIHERDVARSNSLVSSLREVSAIPVTASVGDEPADPTGFDLIVNATPLGMQRGDPLPIDVLKLSRDAFVTDVVTLPAVTPMLEAAERIGCRTVTGVAMFDAVSDYIVDFFLERQSATPSLG